MQKLNNFQRLNRIVERHQCDYFRFGRKRVLVDATTARALLKVYRALNESNQERFRRMIETEAGLALLVDFTWKVVK